MYHVRMTSNIHTYLHICHKKDIIKISVVSKFVTDTRYNIKLIFILNYIGPIRLFIAGRDIVLEHSRFIWQNYEFLTLSLDFDSTFLSRLVELQAISYREYGRLRSKKDRIQRNEALLDIIYRKSPDEFKRFKYTMEETHQNISLKRLKDVTQGNIVD